jgi:hypothetical protein
MTKSDLLRKSIIKLKLQCFFLMSSENVKSFFIFGGKGDTYKNQKLAFMSSLKTINLFTVNKRI